MEKVELLAPVGDEEKLKYALKYGADAVYLGPSLFSLRTSKNAFTLENLSRVIDFVKSQNKKIYLTLNTMPTENLLKKIKEFSFQLRKKDVFPDAFIVSDPGVLELLKSDWGNKVEYHLSTQANCINSLSAKFWSKNGISRVILGRELRLEEIELVRKNVSPQLLKLEVFIHGAMCMAYSGRCLLSSFFTGRDANRGECAHPCRWQYHLMEETRPGEFFPIEEYPDGTYLLNSHDLCAGEDIFRLIEIGIDSLKIEGRNKGTYYVAIVVGVYRRLIDLYYEGKKDSKEVEDLLFQLETVTHRPYSKGFLYGTPRQETSSSKYLWNYRFLGLATSIDRGVVEIEVRNQFSLGEEIELVREDLTIIKGKVITMKREVDGVWQSEKLAKNGWKVVVELDNHFSSSFEQIIVRKKWSPHH